MAVYCISDIHGDIERYRAMFELINFSAEDELYILGDAIDRGHYGVDILLDIMGRDNVHMLLGNHELMCLETFAQRDIDAKRLWFGNGGSCTYRDLVYKRDVDTRNRVLHFLRGLSDHFDIRVGSSWFHLVHAWAGDTTDDRVWTRPMVDDIWHADPVPGSYLVIGHTPVPYFMACSVEKPAEIMLGTHVINIDCGCGKARHGCRLGCIRLDDFEMFYV